MSKLLPSVIKLLCIFFLQLVFLSAVNASGGNQQEELVFLNWSEYMDPDLIARFEKQFNARVTEVFFDSDDARDDIMIATDATGYDVALLNGISLSTYAKAGWIQPINIEKVPNLKHIYPWLRNAFAAAEKYAVPFFSGTVGIAYRSDLVEKAPTSWMDLFRPVESLRGKISMTTDTRDIYGAALKALGYSLNSTSLDENQQAAELMLQQKPYVKTYGSLTLDQTSALVSGDIHMALFYNGDAVLVAEHEDNIEFIVPEEGTNLWIDYLTVMTKAANSELAWKFINFINEPENAAQLAEFLYYATPNKAAEKMISNEQLEDPVIYPPAEIIEKSEFDGVIPARIQKRRNTVLSGLLQD